MYTYIKIINELHKQSVTNRSRKSVFEMDKLLSRTCKLDMKIWFEVDNMRGGLRRWSHERRPLMTSGYRDGISSQVT